MMDAESRLRDAVLEAARAMSARGLSPGRSGNISARTAGGMLITPSGVAYDTMTPACIVAMDLDGHVAAGSLKPSSEWRLHLDIYRARADVGGIAHTHSLHATVLACAHKPIPAFHYMVAVAGGRDIPLAPYATFGTVELSQGAVAAMRSHDACLLANHGQIAVAATPAEALELAAEVETLAEMYVKVLGLGAAHVLPDTEMEVVLKKFATYGQNNRRGGRAPARSRRRGD